MQLSNPLSGDDDEVFYKHMQIAKVSNSTQISPNIFNHYICIEKDHDCESNKFINLTPEEIL